VPETEHANSTTYTVTVPEEETFRCQGNSHESHTWNSASNHERTEDNVTSNYTKELDCRVAVREWFSACHQYVRWCMYAVFISNNVPIYAPRPRIYTFCSLSEEKITRVYFPGLCFKASGHESEGDLFDGLPSLPAPPPVKLHNLLPLKFRLLVFRITSTEN
jgi:hypothetical protein